MTIINLELLSKQKLKLNFFFENQWMINQSNSAFVACMFLEGFENKKEEYLTVIIPSLPAKIKNQNI